MILIPEIETVIILTPRTGSGSLRRAIKKKYPKSIHLYRHMEADGVPAGYDRWRKVGVLRNPLDRLWSLYKYCGKIDGPYPEAFIQETRKSVELPFSEWIVHNENVFISPNDRSGGGEFYPEFTVSNHLPENKKSQFLYLRPDLGTQIFRFDRLMEVGRELGVSLEHHNKTVERPLPSLTIEAVEHMRKWFAWDYNYLTTGNH